MIARGEEDTIAAVKSVLRSCVCVTVAAFAAGCADAQTAEVISVGGMDGGDVPAVTVTDTGPDTWEVYVPPVRCGDSVCTRPMEDCMSCPLDCNQCARCDMAPTCTGALAVPTATTALTDCNNDVGGQRTNYSCGTMLGVPPSATTCADPKLRLRIRDITMTRGFFSLGSNLYCVVSAEDGRHAELLVTTPRSVDGNRNTTHINLPVAQSTFWGQGDLYRSISNITVSYQCWLTSNAAQAQHVLDDISMRAIMASASAGAYGWVFGTVGVLGSVIGGILGTGSDEQVLDVQQTIAVGALLPMTNGRSWDIHRSAGDLGFGANGAWDLHLTVESWGCADVRTGLAP